MVISTKKLIQICSNIDEQTIIDACKWIDMNRIPYTEKISFVIFNRKEYPIKYVLEIANNEIKNNQIKLGPQGDYKTNWFYAEEAMLNLFPNPQKFQIATPTNRNGYIILERYRKQILSYAQSYGAKIQNTTKTWKNVYENGAINSASISHHQTTVEEYSENYTIIKMGKFIAEVSSISNMGNGENHFLFNDIYVGCEKDVNRVLEIISNAAYNNSKIK